MPRDGRSTLTIVRIPQIKLWDGEPEQAGELVRDFFVADVFTGTPLEGNQLGIFPDGRGLDSDLMLKTTRELKFSESVFFLPPDDPEADVWVRIFTPVGEIPFAGHPTLGSAWLLCDILGKQGMGRQTVTLRTGAGLVPVELERDADTITFARMSQPIPVCEPYDQTADLLAALGTAEYGLPVETYVNGPRNVYVEIPTEAALDKLEPDMQALARLPVNVTCYTKTVSGWSSRMFAPALGVPEDPATGSAAGPLAVHLARHGRIAFGEEIEIRQGAQINRPSVLYARAEGTADAVERVLVGGRAVVVARGEYRLG
jgi:trans-2,3-dihydro-3-hydroxyanthranilate isomerase